jgi:glycerol-3-phosphate acyltransferase PlsX
MIRIAVDAMGGDLAPQMEVQGSVQAVQEYPVGVLLVGARDRIQQDLRKYRTGHLPIEIVHASESIAMDEPVSSAIRKKKDSSMRVAAQLVKEGKADGVVSAGNTGACMAIAKLVLGSLANVDRPALAAILPTAKLKPALLIDAGANVDCKPQHLAQFAIMGEIFSRLVFNNDRPKVGLLSIGEEETKGNELTKEAFRLLKTAPFNFVGNIEGRDVFKGEIDVIVCDGFIGNVSLKIGEGLTEMISILLKKDLSSDPISQIGGLLTRRAFRNFKARVDYAETGGAPLLGIRGVAIICHGRSTAKAIKNAIRIAHMLCLNQLNEKIEKEIKALGTLQPGHCQSLMIN